MQNQIVYRATNDEHMPGDIMNPGRWGSIIRGCGEQHPLWNREQLLEKIRNEYFPDKPSRLDCIFAFRNLDTARAYVSLPKQHPGIIYKAVVLDPNASMHVGDLNHIQPIPGVTGDANQVALQYWSGNAPWHCVSGYQNIRWEELLTLSPLRVICRLDP